MPIPIRAPVLSPGEESEGVVEDDVGADSAVAPMSFHADALSEGERESVALVVEEDPVDSILISFVESVGESVVSVYSVVAWVLVCVFVLVDVERVVEVGLDTSLPRLSIEKPSPSSQHCSA